MPRPWPQPASSVLKLQFAAEQALQSLSAGSARKGTLSVPVTPLANRMALWANDQYSYFILRPVLGLPAGLLIYNLFLFFSLLRKALRSNLRCFCRVSGTGQSRTGRAGRPVSFALNSALLTQPLADGQRVSGRAIWGYFRAAASWPVRAQAEDCTG